MSELRYCAKGCKRNGHPTQIEPPAHVCERCEDQIRRWAGEIPNLYALLPRFLEHGTIEKNPDSKATKAATAQAPMRLEIVDLLDERRGRKWLGTEPTDDHRGVYGTLTAIANEIRDGRNMATPEPNSVTGACELITTHARWLTNQDAATAVHDELKNLHRQLSDAVGVYRPKPVGRCHVVPEDAEDPCGGPLLASTYGGVRCPKCGAVWDAEQLRLLGLALASPESA